MKRFISLVMLLIFACTGLTSTASADKQDLLFDRNTVSKEQAIALADRFSYEYEYALVDLENPDFDYVERNESTALFLEYLRYNIETAKVFTLNYTDLTEKDFTIHSCLISENRIYVELYRSFTYHYVDAPEDLISGHGMLYCFEMMEENNKLTIVGVKTESVEYDYYEEEIRAYATRNDLPFVNAAEALTNEKIAQLPDEYAYWCEQVEAFDHKYIGDDYFDETAKINGDRSVNVSFTRSSAVAYGTTFGSQYENYIFKRMGADCTNFVSQCLWAGYGGTDGYSLTNTAALKARVAANYRQTSTWFGRNYDSPYAYGTGPFIRVLELWSHATTNTGDGPRATGYNNGNVWTSLTVVPRTGDVLQFYNFSEGRYYHSVIVTKTTSPTLSNMLDNVWISQHSGEYTNRPLRATLIANGGITNGKMRLMRPKATTFAS
ncbi:MAG: amidase domain-containing protein [Clostridia bacterium]|nr:amidase domain-containing protein [Clostridia bacterium]